MTVRTLPESDTGVAECDATRIDRGDFALIEIKVGPNDTSNVGDAVPFSLEPADDQENDTRRFSAGLGRRAWRRMAESE